MTLKEFLGSIADAIRGAEGSSGSIFAENFAARIAALKAAVKLQSKTVSPATTAQTVTADDGYDGLEQVTVNAMPTVEQATPALSISTGGLVTASATQNAGYVAAGTKSATMQLTTQASKTVTPGTDAQTAVASGCYTTEEVTVAGDSNLVAGNIKSGVSIFGVSGSYAGSGSTDGWTLLAFTNIDGYSCDSPLTKATVKPSTKTLNFTFSETVSRIKLISLVGFVDNISYSAAVFYPPENPTNGEIALTVRLEESRVWSVSGMDALSSTTDGISDTTQTIRLSIDEPFWYQDEYMSDFCGYIAVKFA